MVSGDAFETDHPRLEPAGVGVDVLNVVALPDMLAFRGDDPHVQKPARRRKRGIDFRAVADEQRVFLHDGSEVLRDAGGIHLVEHGVRRRPGPITRNQHRSVLVREENSAFKWPPIVDGVMRMNAAQLAALLDYPC